MALVEWIIRTISESTWGYPIVGALHVLAIALVGGAVMIPLIRVLGDLNFALDVRWIRRMGLTLVVITGGLLFASGAVRYYESTAFRIKMLLLAVIVVNAIAASRRQPGKLHSAISLALWIAVIFVSRGIAFF
jgi:hypothetical protein